MHSVIHTIHTYLKRLSLNQGLTLLMDITILFLRDIFRVSGMHVLTIRWKDVCVCSWGSMHKYCDRIKWGEEGSLERKMGS